MLYGEVYTLPASNKDWCGWKLDRISPSNFRRAVNTEGYFSTGQMACIDLIGELLIAAARSAQGSQLQWQYDSFHAARKHLSGALPTAS